MGARINITNKKIIRVKDDLASGGYKGNLYQRPKKGENTRWPGRVYRISDITISEGDTVLSKAYAEALINFVDGNETRSYLDLVEILNDKRASKQQARLCNRCYDTLESLDSRKSGTI